MENEKISQITRTVIFHRCFPSREILKLALGLEFTSVHSGLLHLHRRDRYKEQGLTTHMEMIDAQNHSVNASYFRHHLIAWGKDHFRAFPWRFTMNPYHILMAEIMLHRTQAAQVAPIYERFVSTYPDLASLSRATPEELHNSLYSLGLRWRVDLIMDMVSQINQRFGGQIPREKADLHSLPGVSDYVASAVRCFAWNLPDAIIDTNTVRVTGRVFGLEIKDSSRRNPLFRKLITDLVDTAQPRVYNFALLDLAAQVCTKGRPPSCDICPLQGCCLYASKTRRLQNIF